jgi:hypothetical protein
MAVARQRPTHSNGSTVGSGGPLPGSITWLTEVEWSELVGEQFSCCEPLLLEAGSWGMWIVRDTRVSGTSAVQSHYWAKTGEDTAVCAVVNCRECELAIAV